MVESLARRRWVACVLVLLGGLLVTGATPAPPKPLPAPGSAEPTSGVDATALPAAARDLLPLITELTATRCPELPPLWVVAQVQAESGWDEGLTAAGPGGPAGLYQLDERNWLAAGGHEWTSDPPSHGAEVTTGAAHLRVAVPWVCTNLRAVSAHLEATGKPTPPLDAMLVCHIAGCGRVTGSASGVPVPGEAGCAQRCAEVIARYLAAVHANLMHFAGRTGAEPDPAPASGAERDPAPSPSEPADPTPAPGPAPGGPVPWTGGATGCHRPDPTGGSCVTGATEHGLLSASTAFGGWSAGPVIRSAGCWNKHGWNPRSDHPRGRACDLFAARPGRFAAGADLAAGWRLAEWLRGSAATLHIKYLIWQGRYWDPGVADQDGWGRHYTGGGVYDIRDATGGHFDHVHVSFRE